MRVKKWLYDRWPKKVVKIIFWKESNLKNVFTGGCSQLFVLLLLDWSRPSTTLSSWISSLLRRIGDMNLKEEYLKSILSLLTVRKQNITYVISVYYNFVFPRYKYSGKEWAVAGKAEPQMPPRWGFCLKLYLKFFLDSMLKYHARG